MKNSIKIYLGLGIGVILIIGILFYFFGISNSFLTIGGNSETRIFNFVGIQGTVTAPFFGTITNSGIVTLNDGTIVKGDPFCGNNNGKQTLYNEIQEGNPLIISSSFKGESCQGNGIQGEVQINPGKLIISCDNSVNSNEVAFQINERANAECLVKVDGKVVFDLKTYQDRGQNGVQKIGTDSKEIIIDKNSKLEFEVRTDGVSIWYSGGIMADVSSTLNIKFIPETVEQPQDSIPEENNQEDLPSNNQDTSNTTQPSQEEQKKEIPIILFIVGGLVIFLVILVIIVFSMKSKRRSR